MIDKLEMRTQAPIDLIALKEVFSNCQLNKVRDAFYRSSIIVRKDGVELITIKSNPIWDDAYQSKVIINPSKWKTIIELTTVLSKLFNISELEITRIDHAVDISIPFEQLYSGLLIKHKRLNNLYKENSTHDGQFLTGCTLGQKPELYCIYDKGYQPISKKLKRDKTYDRGITTRVELRQYKIKVKYKYLLELTNYLNDPPFKGIEYYECNSNASNERANALLVLMKHDGLTRTRATLNKHNNFDRNCKKHLLPNELEDKLNFQYQEELRQFLKL